MSSIQEVTSVAEKTSNKKRKSSNDPVAVEGTKRTKFEELMGKRTRFNELLKVCETSKCLNGCSVLMMQYITGDMVMHLQLRGHC